MYLERYQFQEEPFRLTPDPKYFFSGEQYERVLMELRYGIEQSKGFMVLTGEVGTGKTTVCRTLMDSLGPGIRTALVLNPTLTIEELLKSIIQDFGLPLPSLFPNKKELLDSLNRFLLQAVLKGEGAVLIVDEAQNLSMEIMEELRLLTNLETDKEKLLQILLIGQPELYNKLAAVQLRQLRQRVAVWANLEPLGVKDTRAYINRRIDVATGSPSSIRFSPCAVRRVCRFSHGIPRTINLLCDRALMLAYLENADTVTGRMVRRAFREIVRPVPSGPALKSRTLITATAAFLALTLFPTADISIPEKSHPVSTVEKKMQSPAKQDAAGLYSELIAIEGYGKEVLDYLPSTLTGQSVRQLERSVRSSGFAGETGIRSALIPIDHPLWLKTGSVGIVDASDGAMLLIEPKWGEGRQWRILDQVNGEMFRRTAAAWDVALVAYRPFHDLRVPLREGDRGSAVTFLQEALVRLDLLKGSEVDGIYGNRTAGAVTLLQKQCYLNPTGVLDDSAAYYLTRYLRIRN